MDDEADLVTVLDNAAFPMEEKLSSIPPPVKLEIFMNSRLFISLSFSSKFNSSLDGLMNPGISAASADVAGHSFHNFFV